MKASQIAGMSNSRVVGDLYRTPTWATEALFEREVFKGNVLEPACGLKDMSKVIGRYNKCVSKDIMYGDNFLHENDKYDNVITNPPYKYAKEFVLKAKEVANERIALLCKLVFLESISRYKMFKDKSFPLEKVYIFCSRVNFLSEKDPRGEKSSTMAMAWFVWNRQYRGKPYLEWIKQVRKKHPPKK